MRRAREEASGTWAAQRGTQHEIAHLAADAHGMSVRAFVAQCATADCARAIAPIDGFVAKRLLADKNRDTDEMLVQAEEKPQGAA